MEVFVHGGRAAEAHQVVVGVDVLIVSIPFAKVPAVRPLLDSLPSLAAILDSSNYYPAATASSTPSKRECLRASGSPSSSRPVSEAWNSITAQSFATKNASSKAPHRVALPVSADSQSDRDLAIALVEETGFDEYDAWDLAGSWRQQPGAPAHCADLTLAELPEALAAAVATRSPRRRELAWDVIDELTQGYPVPISGDLPVALNRSLYVAQGRGGR